MPYFVTVIKGSAHVYQAYIYVQEPMNYSAYQILRDDLLALRDALLAQSNYKNIIRAVINLKKCMLSETTSKWEQYMFSKEWKNMRHHNLYIAVVLPEYATDQDQMYFVIHTSAKYGMRMIPFYDENDAVNWVLNET